MAPIPISFAAPHDSSQASRRRLPNENSTATLCGINERNYNRQPVTLWVRETQGNETREIAKIPWVYLSQLLSDRP
jgi:hypothetical protein